MKGRARKPLTPWRYLANLSPKLFVFNTLAENRYRGGYPHPLQRRLLRQPFNRCNRAEQFGWQMVPLREVFNRVVADPDCALRILGDEQFQRQVDRDRGGREHQGCAARRSAIASVAF
jgi:hypothetical protein